MVPVASPIAKSSRPLPATFWAGLAIIAIAEVLLAADVLGSGRSALRTNAAIVNFKGSHRPEGVLACAARFVAVNMTAIAWVGYLCLVEGLLVWRSGSSPVRCRPNHFALLCLASVTIWCAFDTVNFYSIGAWRYIGMPASFAHRAAGYLLAFGAIVPGMLMSGQLLLELGVFRWARRPGSDRIPTSRRWETLLLAVSVLAGAGMSLWPVICPDPVTTLTLWAGPVFLLDPVNYWLGRPSMWGDWFRGNFARTLAAFGGGLLCGLLWEFWNYWALAKWVYHLPFLGWLENVRYFEMPALGLIGFIPFGLECWVIWQTMRIPLDGVAEALPDDQSLL